MNSTINQNSRQNFNSRRAGPSVVPAALCPAPGAHAPRRPGLIRGAAAVALAAVGLLFGGCATYSAKDNLELFTRTAPLPKLVPADQVMAAAEAAAAKDDGDFALHGMGASMEPVYQSGTAIVVHPCSYHALRKGMAVVYINRRGFHVAHMLVEDMPKGWFAIGLNNDEVDDDLVTARNLVGVIRYAFSATDTQFRPDVAARIAMRDAIVNGGQKVSLLH